VSLNLVSERQTEVHLRLVSSVTGRQRKLRPRGALAPRNLFIGSKSPFAQIILNNSMETVLTTDPKRTIRTGVGGLDDATVS
jgi:hypothetical protein